MVSRSSKDMGEAHRRPVLLLGLGLSLGLALLFLLLATRSSGSVRSRPARTDEFGQKRDNRAAKTSGRRRQKSDRVSRRGRTHHCRQGMVATWRMIQEKNALNLDAPALDAALGSLKSWWRMAPDPYDGSLGKAGPYMVGLARPDIDGFIQGRPSPVGRGDPGPSSGMSEAMTSVLLPPPGTLSTEVSLPQGRIQFRLWAGVVPRGRPGRVRFSFDVTALDQGSNAPGPSGSVRSGPAGDPGSIHEEVELIRARGRWIPVTMDLSALAGRRVRIVIETTGQRAVPSFVADPVLWTEGCLPGRNILLLVIDTMRADAFDILAGRRGVTPNLDALARRGVSFDQARSLGTWTRPSMTAILASDWANHLGVSRTRFRLTEAQRRDIHGRLRHRLSSLFLRRRGYFTEAVGNNFFFLEHTPIGLDRGFERVVDIRGRGGKDSLAAVAELSRFFSRHRDRPFFLWVHLDGSHWPYLPPKGYEVRGARAPGAPHDRAYEAYLGEVRWSDEILGHVLDLLDKNGLTDKTLVAVTADHGETFADAHSFVMGHIRTRHAHGWSVYEELLHVPLVLSGPGLPKGLRVAHPVSHLHLMPTLFDYAGLGTMQRAKGKSLRPVMEQPEGPAPGWLWPIVSEGRHMEALRTGRLKYIRRWGFVTRIRRGRQSETLHDELYDLDRDPGETKNLAPRRPATVQRLKTELARIVETGSGDATGDVPSGPFSDVAERRGGPGASRAHATALHLGLWSPAADKPGGHKLLARIGCKGGLAMGRISAGARVSWQGASTVSIELPSSPGRLVQVSVILGCPRPHLTLHLDGRLVRASSLRVGPYGLRLLDDYSVIDESIQVAAEAPDGPIDPRSNEVGCFLWTRNVRGHGTGTPGSGTRPSGRFQPSGPGARQVDRLLQQWGYSKDH